MASMEKTSSVKSFGSGSMGYRAYLSVSTTTSNTQVKISYTAKVQMRYACYYGVKIAVSGGNSAKGYLTSDPGSSFVTVATTTGSFTVNRGTSDSTKTIKATASGCTVDGVGGAGSSSVSVSLTVDIPKKPSYTVSYNANGGSGAPSSQTKWYGTTLTLSNTKPTRSGYNFKGWGASSTATSAIYSAGGKYTANASATLYAVWALAYAQPAISNIAITRCTSNGTAASTGKYFKVSFNWTLDPALTLKSGTITCDTASATISAVSAASGPMSKVIGGSFDPLKAYTVTISLTDTASVTKSFTVNIPAITYSAPQVTSLAAIRCNSSYVEDVEGTYGKVTISWSVDTLDGSNSCQSIAIGYREKGTSGSYTSVTVSGTTTGTSGTATANIGNVLNTGKSYDINIVITDKVASLVKTAIITQSYFTVDYLSGGKGVAFGKAATNEGFECAMPATFINGLVSNSGTSQESQVKVENAAGNIYFYSQASETGSRGIYTFNASGEGRYVFNIDKDNNLNFGNGLQAYGFDVGNRSTWHGSISSDLNGQCWIFCGKWMIGLLVKTITPSGSKANYTGTYTWTFNNAFSGVPYVFTSMSSTSSINYLRCTPSSMTTTSVKLTLVRGNKTDTTCFAVAIGPRD